MVIHNCLLAVLIIITYTLSIMVPPAIVFYPKVKNRSLSIRLSIYFLCGNVFFSNAAFLLTYLHIFYTPVVWIVLIAATTVAAFKTRHIPLKNLPVYVINFFIGLLANDLGGRFAFRQLISYIARGIKSAGRWIMKNILKKPARIIITILTLAMVFYVYNEGILKTFGYHASDVPVHNYWINEMVMHQKLFAAGLYPFGYHTVIAYFYLLFRIPLMHTLSFYNYVIIIYTVFFMVAVGIKITKSYIAGYVAPFIYFGAGLLYVNCINRYSAPLPQEFGLIFMLAGIVFAIDFFRKNGKDKELARQDIYCFALAVSMCLSSHLYTGIALMIACVCIGISRIPKTFNLHYLLPLLKAALVGIALAGWAIGIGFAMGTPMQGSAEWARQVTEQQVTDDDSESDDTGSADTSASTVKKQKNALLKRIDTVSSYMDSYIFYSTIDYRTGQKIAAGIIYVYLFMIAFSFLMRFRSRDYGCNLLFTSLFGLSLLMLFSMLALGLSPIIDTDRAKSFFVMWTSIAVCVFFDAVVTFITGFKRRTQRIALNVVVTAAVCVGGCVSVVRGYLRSPVGYIQMEKNGAIISLTNILRGNRNHTYTVVSANDELHMMETQGYHVEINELLSRIEHPDTDTSFTIPTSKVYFFVEKKPLSYYDIGYEQNDRMVSAEGAREALPDKANGIYIYMGENRYIEMSRMYYFVEELMRRYPEHMHTYYEDSDFICVCLDQDENAPMNLAIDYGYNK